MIMFNKYTYIYIDILSYIKNILYNFSDSEIQHQNFLFKQQSNYHLYDTDISKNCNVNVNLFNINNKQNQQQQLHCHYNINNNNYSNINIQQNSSIFSISSSSINDHNMTQLQQHQQIIPTTTINSNILTENINSVRSTSKKSQSSLLLSSSSYSSSQQSNLYFIRTFVLILLISLLYSQSILLYISGARTFEMQLVDNNNGYVYTNQMITVAFRPIGDANGGKMSLKMTPTYGTATPSKLDWDVGQLFWQNMIYQAPNIPVNEYIVFATAGRDSGQWGMYIN